MITETILLDSCGREARIQPSDVSKTVTLRLGSPGSFGSFTFETEEEVLEFCGWLQDVVAPEFDALRGES